MRRELIIGVALLAALGAACGGSKTARPEPPLATLAIAWKEQIAGLGSYCWREDGRGLCRDAIGISTAWEPLLAGSPFAARLRLPVEGPVMESQLNVYPVTGDDQLGSEAPGLRWWRPKSETREQFTLPLERETIVELSLEPGLYVLSVFARWQGRGDAGYGFLVEVR